MNKKSKKSGFTLIEVSISLTFIGVLLVILAVVIINIITIYQKGITTKTINSVGTALVDDIKRSIAQTPTEDLTDLCLKKEDLTKSDCDKDKKGWFNIFVYHANSMVIDGMEKPTNGVFCTGNYSYIWNTQYAKNSGATARANGSDDFNIYKFIDLERDACYKTYKSGNIDYNTSAEPTELVADQEVKLSLYNFTIFPPAIDMDSLQTFYSGTFLLSRAGDPKNDMGTLTNNELCKELNIDGSAVDNMTAAYCSINKFNFAARATGE